MPTPQRRGSKHRELAKPSIYETLKHQKWLTLIGLPVLLGTTITGVYTLWGVLFIYWGVASLRSGQVFLLETIERRHDPALFWIIVALWVLTGGIYVIGDFFPSLWY